MSKKASTDCASTWKIFGEELCKVLAIEGRGQREHRVVESHTFQLHDRVRDLLSPVASTAFDHADRKTVQRDVEDVTAGAFEPRGHATEFVVLFEQADTTPLAGQDVGGGEATETAADHDDVVVVFGVFEEVFRHMLVRSLLLFVHFGSLHSPSGRVEPLAR